MFLIFFTGQLWLLQGHVWCGDGDGRYLCGSEVDVEGDDVAVDERDGVVDVEGLSAGESLHFLRVILC